MSVGAICFTSSGSNGGHWVVLVPPPPFFAKMFFFHTRLMLKKKVYAIYTKKKSVEKKTRLTQKKSELHLFPQSSYTFLYGRGYVATLVLTPFRRSLSTPFRGPRDVR